MPAISSKNEGNLPRNVMPVVQQLADRLRQNGWRLTTAESCTGGMVAAACTDLAGSSEWFERGFVTYSNEAKNELLGVDAALIAEQGAVSEAVASAMAEGALAHSRAQVSIAITGIAGPGGGSAAKPVGLVWFAWALPNRSVFSEQHIFTGDRAAVRAAAQHHALAKLLALL